MENQILTQQSKPFLYCVKSVSSTPTLLEEEEGWGDVTFSQWSAAVC